MKQLTIKFVKIKNLSNLINLRNDYLVICFQKWSRVCKSLSMSAMFYDVWPKGFRKDVKVCEVFEIGAVQKCDDLVDLQKYR